MASFANSAKKQNDLPDPALKTKHFLLLESKIESLSALGSVLIAGIEREGDDDEEEEEEDEEMDDDACYTEEQIKGLRHIIITKNREKEIERNTNKFGGGGFMEMFNTQTGNEAIHYIPIVVKKYMKKTSLSENFDGLFAMTYALNNFDTWMYDNEEYGPGARCDKAIRTLAKAWRTLMSHSDTELGIDAEFTRPGIVSLLNTFKDNIADIPDQEYYRFNWDGSYDDEEEEEEEEEENEDDCQNSAEDKNDLDEDEDDSDSDEDDDDDDEDDYNGDEGNDFDENDYEMVCDDGTKEDMEVPKELLQRAMDAYNSIVVNIPEDSDSD